jgi:3-dehydroquinate dehydratase II
MERHPWWVNRIGRRSIQALRRQQAPARNAPNSAETALANPRTFSAACPSGPGRADAVLPDRTSMSHPLFVLNGANLNMLGRREPELYGRTTLAEIEAATTTLAAELGLACDFRQTNHEGVLVDWIQEACLRDAAVIINPAGFSFGRVPVIDALKLLRQPVVEVHITNIHQRPLPYTHSLVSTVATGVICGLGSQGYLLAVRALADTLKTAATPG